MAFFETMKETGLDLNLITHKTGKRMCLVQIDKVVPLDNFVDPIAPY